VLVVLMFGLVALLTRNRLVIGLAQRAPESSIARRGAISRTFASARQRLAPSSVPSRLRVLARVLRFFLRVLSNDFECLT
jgi:hypothetical protein